MQNLKGYSCYFNVSDKYWIHIWVNKSIRLNISKYPMLKELEPDIPKGSIYFWPTCCLYLLIHLYLWSCKVYTAVINNNTVQTTTNMIPQYATIAYSSAPGKRLDELRSYQRCPLLCCCMEVEPQLLPVDSLLGPPHWAAVGREKPLSSSFKATIRWWQQWLL